MPKTRNGRHSGPGRPPDRGWLAAAGWLTANPGRWALIASGVHPTTHTAVIQGKITAFRPAGHFKARMRKTTSTSTDLYAMYAPPPPEENTE